MKTIDVLDALVDYAKNRRTDISESIVRSKHMNDLKGNVKISQEVIDAVLVDFINQIGAMQGIDYALYTKDLRITKKEIKK
jgi:hypothetical protein